MHLESLAFDLYSEKQLKDIKILLTFSITFKKIIFNQNIIISYRTSTVQFSKMQNEIYGSLVTIQYNLCTNPLYPKLKSNKSSAYIIAATFTWLLFKF